MKICVLNSYYSPWIGGVERYISSISNELVKRGHSVTVYCADRPLNPGTSFDGNIRVERMVTPLIFYGTPLTLFPKEIIREDYDVIHSNFPSPYISAAAAFFSHVKDVPAVLTWHNDLPPITKSASLLVAVHQVLSEFYLRIYRRIIATTQAYVELSPILQKYQNKVSVIPNGVNIEKFNPSVQGDLIRSKYKLVGKKVILFVGALTVGHSYKGVDLLLEAFRIVDKRCRSIRLVIVGSGNMINEYKRMAHELGLEGKVIFTGQVNDDYLPQYYAASDIFVLPSKNFSEGYGLVLLEAMASRKAVIGSAVGGITDVISNGKNGFLAEPNSLALAESIITLLEDEELRIKMGIAGRQFAEKHDWEIITGKIEHIYRSVLK